MAAVDVTSAFPTTAAPFNSTLLKTSLGVKATIVSWLCFFMMVGFIGNCMLVATVVQSRRLRTTPIHVVICSMSVVNLLDVVFNCSIILGALASGTWSFGLLVCDLQAGLILLTSMNMVLHIVVLAADRLLSVVSSKKYLRRRTYIIMCVMVSYCWLHSSALSLPLMSSAIPSQLNSNRYHCALKENVSFGYISIVLITYIVCILFILSVGMVIVCHVVKTRLQENQTVTYVTTQSASETKKQFKASLHFGIISALWGVFCAPYVFLTYSEQFVSVANEWQVDVSITWMRLSFPVFLPPVTFMCIRDAWIKFRSHAICMKKNHVTGPSASSGSTPVGTPEPSPKRNAEVKVPVLFATENGLHYQTYENQESYTEDVSEHDHNETQATDITTARKCDVYGSQDFVQMEDETSDYSSVQDPFSTSNPISIRDQFAAMEETNDLHLNGNVPQDGKPGDSGIDSVPGTKEKKKKNKNQVKRVDQQNIQEYPSIDRNAQLENHIERFGKTDNSNDKCLGPITSDQPTRKKKHKKNKIVDDAVTVTGDHIVPTSNAQPTMLQPLELKSERIELGDVGSVNIISETDIGEDLPSCESTPEKNADAPKRKKKERHSKHEKHVISHTESNRTVNLHEKESSYPQRNSWTVENFDKNDENFHNNAEGPDTGNAVSVEEVTKHKRRKKANYVNDAATQERRKLPKLQRANKLHNVDVTDGMTYGVTGD